MNPSARIASYAWLAALLGAGGFCLWLALARSGRVAYVSNLVPTDAVVDPASPTGYAGGLRQLVVPENNNDSCEWIVQTQQMLARHQWRVHHVAYDNAPVGRDVLAPSPYRWWLGSVAWMDHLVSRRPVGLSVERAATIADPALQLLLLLGTAVFVARRFGAAAAAMLAAAVATLYPFGGTFLPGEPHADGLAEIFAVWSVLLLLAGVGVRARANVPPDPSPVATDPTRRWFVAAGIVGGIGLWIDAVGQALILAGIVLGGLGAAWIARRRAPREGQEAATPLPWRQWALAGATTSLVAYFVEYSPGLLGRWSLEAVHPVYGLAWLGAGEWLAQFDSGSRGRRACVILAVATLPLAALGAIALLPANHGLFAADATTTRLTALSGSPAAPNLWTWIRHDGPGLAVLATGLPAAALLAAGGWVLAHPASTGRWRTMTAVALGPVVAGVVLGCFRLRWWNSVDGGLLTLLVAVAPALWWANYPRLVRWGAAAAIVLSLVPGSLLLVRGARADAQQTVSENEVESLIERDLAQWLARASGTTGAIVLAPPNLTTSLYFYGGMAGLGTLDRDNRSGVLAAIRLAGASSPDEAQALAHGRNLNYIVMPSWDNSLDVYARVGSNQYDHTLVALLHRWLPPRWLKPVPYHLPTITGFEGQSVAVFEVVDVQDNATALSHLAEYFIEMDQIPHAIGVAYTLQHSFPADLGAAVARTLVAQASGDADAFDAALGDVQTLLARGDDRTLPWDRRVSLAIALAEGKRTDLARRQVEQCLATATEARVRSLTTLALFRLQVLSRAFGLRVDDVHLRNLMRQLLPAEIRDKV